MPSTTFRKKPVEVEAIRCVEALSTASNDWPALPDWLAAAYEKGDVLFLADGIEILTLEGTMRAEKGDWIIQGTVGELYPCKPAAFDATFERVA